MGEGALQAAALLVQRLLERKRMGHVGSVMGITVDGRLSSDLSLPDLEALVTAFYSRAAEFAA